MLQPRFVAAEQQVIARTGPYTINRAWENWCRRAGRPFEADGR